MSTIWFDAENDQYGIQATADADRRALIAELVWDVEGLRLHDLADDDVSDLAAALRYIPLRSVVKADLDMIDADTCGGWHSEASGKRVMPAWFIESHQLSEVINAQSPAVGVSRKATK